MKLLIFLILFYSLGAFGDAADGELDRKKAEKEIKYLSLESFPELNIVKNSSPLLKGCIVPQNPRYFEKPNNVLVGSFSGTTNKDIAILCSKNGKTSIIVLWQKGQPCPAEFEENLNSNLLEIYVDNDDTKVAFSRLITKATKTELVNYASTYKTFFKNANGGPLKEKVTHEGISDSGDTYERPTLFYCIKGKWLKLVDPS
jgi:hypothetical protein